MHGRNDRKVSLGLGSIRRHHPDLAASLARQVRNRALEDNIAIIHNRKIARCLRDILDDVGGEQHSSIPRQFREQIAEMDTLLRVKPCRRLVNDQ